MTNTTDITDMTDAELDALLGLQPITAERVVEILASEGVQSVVAWNSKAGQLAKIALGERWNSPRYLGLNYRTGTVFVPDGMVLTGPEAARLQSLADTVNSQL